MLLFKLKKSLDDYSSIICETCDNELRNMQAYRKDLIQKQRKLNKFVSDAKKDLIPQVKKEFYSSDEDDCNSDEIDGDQSEDEDIEECEVDDDDGEEDRFEKFKVKKCKFYSWMSLNHSNNLYFRLL